MRPSTIEYEDGSVVALDEDDAPELTDADMLWMVASSDFKSHEEAERFLTLREGILQAAEAAGIPRETFLPFAPNKPGFEERAKVLMKLPKALGWAAE